MKIFDEQGKRVGEIDKPGPVEQDGVWYEAVEYRPARKNELTLDTSWQDYGAPTGLVRAVMRDTKKEYWIISPVPTPTLE